MSTRDRIDLIEIINQVQNDNNSFVNVDEDDIQLVYDYWIKSDMNTLDVEQFLKDLGYV